MQELLNVPERTLRDWKKGNREQVYYQIKLDQVIEMFPQPLKQIQEE